MKYPAYLAGILTGVAIFILACGGGSGSGADAQPTVTGESLHDYLPYFSGNSHGVFVTDAGAIAGEWTSTPGRVRWGDSIERWELATCSDGQQWAIVTGYESASPATAGQFYRVEIVKQTVNGTPLQCPGQTGVYLPIALPPGGSLDVEAWFLIHAAPPLEASTREGYWRGRYVFGGHATNDCWKGPGPHERRVIGMQEAWWDDPAGWVRGSAPTLPWAGGNPQPVAVHFDFQTTIARDAGILWTSNAGLCLHHVDRS